MENMMYFQGVHQEVESIKFIPLKKGFKKRVLNFAQREYINCRRKMDIASSLQGEKKTAFSFEVLPPLKGNNIEGIYKIIDSLLEFNPKCINITTHRSEEIYQVLPNGLYTKISQKMRPGSVAVAASIQNKYHIPVVPHVICSGFSKSEIEYELIDLSFLGITNVFLLRGDKARNERSFTPLKDGYAHTTELQEQVNLFNDGKFIDGTRFEKLKVPFSYGVAGYPEKHDEAPNMDSDIDFLKEKVDAGAKYIVTQMFFDNTKYFDFVKRCREAGITIPIIPGLKPIVFKSQLNALPKIFHVDIPEAFAKELEKCKTDEEVTEVGIEWCIVQAKELIKMNVPCLHFYTLMASKSVKRIAKSVY